MYLKCRRSINPKFTFCQLSIKPNSKNKTEDLVCWRSVLLSRLAPLLLYIIMNSGNASFIRGNLRNPTFQAKCLEAKDIGFQKKTVVWKSSILDLVEFLY